MKKRRLSPIEALFGFVASFFLTSLIVMWGTDVLDLHWSYWDSCKVVAVVYSTYRLMTFWEYFNGEKGGK